MLFPGLDGLLEQALQEDIGRGDVTTRAVLGSAPKHALSGAGELIARESGVLAGWPVFVRVFQLLGEVQAEVACEEGSRIVTGQTVGRVAGPVAVLLSAERTALNLLQRLSGIATKTRACVEQVAATEARIVDTRKTTPLWRALEKYAVRVGGGDNHRMGLDDGFLIKENHIAAAGSIGSAIESCRRQANHLQKIEVEVTNLEELEQALSAKADAILLDNMDPEVLRKAVQRIDGRCVVEVSGGITSENILAYAEAGVDLISIGALTHSAPSVDLSFLVKIDG